VALELARYNIDIAALSETRLHGEDSLTEVGAGYAFFHVIQQIPTMDKLILMGDFNARVGTDHLI